MSTLTIRLRFYRYAEANGWKTGNRGRQGAEGQRQFRGSGRFSEGNRNNDLLQAFEHPDVDRNLPSM